jgi:hypothetical protein
MGVEYNQINYLKKMAFNKYINMQPQLYVHLTRTLV